MSRVVVSMGPYPFFLVIPAKASRACPDSNRGRAPPSTSARGINNKAEVGACLRSLGFSPSASWRAERVCTKAKLKDVTPHVLRDTFASVAGEFGFPELTIAGLLGHSWHGVTEGSKQKTRYICAIAEAQIGGQVDLERLDELDDEAAVAALAAIKGIGRWTAEAFLMSSEGRTDFFPAGDLALQEGLRLADWAKARLSEKELYARAERWRPYRGVAAHLVRAYYGGIKRGEIRLPEPEIAVQALWETSAQKI